MASTVSPLVTTTKSEAELLEQAIQLYGYVAIQTIQNFTLLFMVLCFIFFVYHFLKRTPGICTVYFYLLFTGLVWGISGLFWTDLSWITDYRFKWIESANSCFQWYTAQFTAIWTLVLSINRCTAIVWWQKHNVLWGRHWPKVVAFMWIYPFLLNGYSFFNIQCRFKMKTCKDPNYWAEDASVTTIACVVIAIVSLALSIFSTIKYWTQFSKKSNSMANANTETKLLYQALLSSITFVIYALLRVYGQYARQQPREVFSQIGYWAAQLSMTLPYVIHELSAFILVFVFSVSVRRKLFSFYYIPCMAKDNYERGPGTTVVTLASGVSESKMYSTTTV